MNLLGTPRTVNVLCQGNGHVVAQCPSRNLLVREVDEIETVVYEPTDNVTDSDDDVRVSSIQLGIVRCSHTTVRDEDWHRSSVSHTYIKGRTTN